MSELKEDKYAIAFVDTENVSPCAITKLISYLKYDISYIHYVGTWCYGLDDQKSAQSCSWKNEIEELKSFHWKRVYVKRRKNAVDEAVIKDINNLLLKTENDRLSHYVIVASDGDYYDVIKKLKSHGKYVTVITTGPLADKIRAVCDKYIEI